jgi:thioredoxin 1
MSSQDSHVIDITSSDLYEKAKARPGLLVVKFSAEWCGPCKQIQPFYEECSRVFDRALFAHVDVDEMGDELDDCGDIRGVPTFKFFVNGELKEKFSGADPKTLQDAIRRNYV